METTHPKTEAVQNEPQPRRFTRDEYYEMGDMGWFEGCRVELIDGEVLEKFPDRPPAPAPYRWTRDQYYRMAELGWFDEQRTELIEGEIFIMSPQNWAHASTVDRVAQLLETVFLDGFWVRTQLPVALHDQGEPEPDVSVVTGARDDYGDHPADAVLVVEVSNNSLRNDRNRKASLYAKAGIADYWIVNLIDNQLEVFRNPSPDDSQPFGFAYTEKTIYQPDDTIAPLATPNAPVKVADLLP